MLNWVHREIRMISGSSRIDEMKKNKTKGLFASIVLGVAVTACAPASSCGTVTVVDRPDIQSVNTNYIGYRAPLRPLNFIKLPVGSIQPEGWVKKYLELQRDGLTGHLGEISAWLEKDNNAWLKKPNIGLKVYLPVASRTAISVRSMNVTANANFGHR